MFTGSRIADRASVYTYSLRTVPICDVTTITSARAHARSLCYMMYIAIALSSLVRAAEVLSFVVSMVQLNNL